MNYIYLFIYLRARSVKKLIVCRVEARTLDKNSTMNWACWNAPHAKQQRPGY